MNALDFKILWSSWVGPAELLFAARALAAAPILIFSILSFYEFVAPLHRHPLIPAREQGIWRWLSAIIGLLSFGLFLYYMAAGYVEKDRGGAPFSYMVYNILACLLFICMCLAKIKRRKESWERKYLSEEF